MLWHRAMAQNDAETCLTLSNFSTLHSHRRQLHKQSSTNEFVATTAPPLMIGEVNEQTRRSNDSKNTSGRKLFLFYSKHRAPKKKSKKTVPCAWAHFQGVPTCNLNLLDY